MPITVAIPVVNLQVASGSVHPSTSSASVGGSIALSWQVTNVGNEPANASWLDQVFISSSSTFNVATATYLGSYSAPSASLPLAANGTYTQLQTVNLPSNFSPGTYYLHVVANADNRQSEGNTTDNVSTDIVPITLTAPDLQVTSVTGPTGTVSKWFINSVS